jgi:hypothetical protein
LRYRAICRPWWSCIGFTGGFEGDGPIAIEFNFMHPAGTLGQFLGAQEQHWLNERRLALAGHLAVFFEPRFFTDGAARFAAQRLFMASAKLFRPSSVMPELRGPLSAGRMAAGALIRDPESRSTQSVFLAPAGLRDCGLNGPAAL